jgi:Tfp pilus assembly protein PilV
MKFPPKKQNSGFTLVETLIALLIFTMSMLALMSVLGSGISDTGYAKQKMAAGYLAQEGIECVRNMRDTSVLYNAGGAQDGWNEFKDVFSSIITSDNDICPITNPDFASFSRVISADTASFGADEIKVFSTVSWEQGSGTYNIVFSENLYNWVE